MLTALAAALALLVAVPAASAKPAATSVATKGCWLDVINDWLDNNRVDKTYPTPCYTQAIQQLNKYPDVQNYSSAADDIQRALLAAIHDRTRRRHRRHAAAARAARSGGSSSGSSGGSSGGSSSDPISSVFDSGRPSNAQSVPLPLLVLGGLAALLLLSAVGTWIARRIQARRGPAARRRPSTSRAETRRGIGERPVQGSVRCPFYSARSPCSRDSLRRGTGRPGRKS